MLIFVIFVVHLGVMKFSTHEIFSHQLSIYMCLSLDRRRFVMTLFCYLRPIDCALDSQDPLSQAVLCVIAEEVNREVQKAEARPTEMGPVPVVQRSRA